MLSTISLFGLALLLRRRLQLQFGQALFTAATGLVAFLFVAGVCNALWLATWVAIGAGLVAGLLSFTGRNEDTRLWRKQPILLLVLAGGLFLVSRPGAYAGWDEFSHWGVIIKHIAEVHSLYLSQSLLFPDYPPGLALFAYFVSTPAGSTEPDALYASSLFLLCMGAVLVAHRRMLESILALGIFYLLSFAFGTGPTTVLIDVTLGAIFGGMVCVYLSEASGAPAKAAALIIMPAVSLVLFKAAGTSLAVIAIAVVGVDAFLVRRRERLRVALALLAALFATGVAYGLWKLVINIGGYLSRTARFDLGYPVGVILGRNPNPVSHEILVNFLHAMMGSFRFYYVNAGLPEVAGVVLLFLLAAVAMAPEGDRLARALIIVTMSLGAALYSYGLLATYLTNMSEYEGVRLASFDRYQGVYLVGVSMVAVAFLTKARHRDAGLLALVAAIVVLTRAVPSTATELLRFGAPAGNATRSDVQQRVLPLLSFIPKDSKVYVIWDGSNGYEYFMTKFELMPRAVNNSCWAVAPEQTDDMYRCQMSASTFSKELEGYDYLYVAQAPASFFGAYASLFGGTEAPVSSLFEVITTEGKLRLSPVD